MTRPVFRPAFYPAFRPTFNKLKSISAAVRSVYNFDGVDDVGVLLNRAINPDEDIDIEFRTGATVPVNPAAAIVLISQNLSGTSSNWEFAVRAANPSGNVQLIIGGVFAGHSNAPIAPNTHYRITLVGTALNYYINGMVAASYVYTRGTAREPTAVTAIGARTNSTIGTYVGRYTGQLFDVKINGVLYPIYESSQSIQLPLPTGLGSEIITPAVHAAPFAVGSQWTHLGGGRWQYIGDGSQNTLRFVSDLLHPTAGFFEFEVESHSGGNMRCTSGFNPPNTVGSAFSGVGIKRMFYTNFATPANVVSFQRLGSGDIVSCIIKNMSFKPLGTCNPLTLLNTTADRWQDVPA